LKKKHQNSIYGRLEGSDLLIFKGYLTGFFNNQGFYYFLSQKGILLKNYGEYVKQTTTKLKDHITQIISTTGCYYEYLTKSGTNKEAIAKEKCKSDKYKKD